MRLISYNGIVDLPYENTVVICSNGTVLGIYKGKEYVLGEYSSKDKSYKTMEMLHEAYVGKLVLQNNIEMSKGVEEMLKNWKSQMLLVSEAEKPRVDYINNQVFQFPKDEKIEV